MQYLLFLSSFLILSLVAQPSQLFAQKKLKKQPTLQSTECWTYTIADNRPGEAYQSSSSQYNKSGKKIASKDFHKDGLLANDYTYEYKKQQQDCYWTDAEGNKVLGQSEFYNEQGQVIKRIRYKADKSQMDALTFEYANDQKSLEVYYNEKKERVYSIQYIYNKDQNTIRENYTNHLNQESFIAAIDLNNQALPLTYTQYKTTGPLVQSVQYTRDEQGRVLTKETYSSKNELKIKEVYQYSPNSKQYSVYIDGGKRLVEHVVYKYQYFN